MRNFRDEFVVCMSSTAGQVRCAEGVSFAACLSCLLYARMMQGDCLLVSTRRTRVYGELRYTILSG